MHIIMDSTTGLHLAHSSQSTKLKACPCMDASCTGPAAGPQRPPRCRAQRCARHNARAPTAGFARRAGALRWRYTWPRQPQGQPTSLPDGKEGQARCGCFSDTNMGMLRQQNRRMSSVPQWCWSRAAHATCVRAGSPLLCHSIQQRTGWLGEDDAVNGRQVLLLVLCIYAHGKGMFSMLRSPSRSSCPTHSKGAAKMHLSRASCARNPPGSSSPWC